jgi:hypothetical protein
MTASHDRAFLRADTQKPTPRPRRMFSPLAPAKDTEMPDLGQDAKVIPIHAQQVAQVEIDHPASTETTVNPVPDVAPEVYTGRAADHLRDLAKDLKESDINTPDPTIAELMDTIWVPRSEARNSVVIQSGLAVLGILQVMGLYAGLRLVRTIFATKATTAITVALGLLTLIVFASINAAN